MLLDGLNPVLADNIIAASISDGLQLGEWRLRLKCLGIAIPGLFPSIFLVIIRYVAVCAYIIIKIKYQYLGTLKKYFKHITYGFNSRKFLIYM